MARFYFLFKNKNILRLSIVGLLLVFASLSFKTYSTYQNDLIKRSQKIAFPGTTYVNINRTIRHLHLVESSPAHDVLTDRGLKALSSFFIDKNVNLTLVIAESKDQQIFLSIIKNGTLIQNQKINQIDDQIIHLQYGQIVLNTDQELTATLNPTDIF